MSNEKTQVRRVDILVAEIGSTTTVISAVDTESSRLLGQGFAPTTPTGVTIGLQAALACLSRNLGSREVVADTFLASSSAAGGLKMTVHGLVYDMTARAAREAALGAGAVVRLITAGPLTDEDLRLVREISPGIILLAGGVDYGEKEVVLDNARRLAGLGSGATVVYAGNRVVAGAIHDIFAAASVECRVVENVYPQIDVLNVEPARRVIGQVFEDRIVDAPGMDGIRRLVDGHIIPTPGAVFNAAVLLYEEIGDLLVVDVGGATTDVHSVTPGDPELNLLAFEPEPLAKRTVEGDLGVVVNAPVVLSRLDRALVSEMVGGDPEPVLAGCAIIPVREQEIRLTEALTREAVRAAVARHAGRVKTNPGIGGRPVLVKGRDLTKVRWIIGTGGPLTRLPFGPRLLEEINGPGPGRELFPRRAGILIDKDYIMAPAGVLSLTRPDVARKLLRQSLGLGIKEMQP